MLLLHKCGLSVFVLGAALQICLCMSGLLATMVNCRLGQHFTPVGLEIKALFVFDP